MKLTVTYDPVIDASNYVRAIFDAAYMSYGRTDLPGMLLGMVEN
jgi:hypothetical protein